jgi:hypothetical protein
MVLPCPPCPRCFFSNLFAPLRAQFLGAGVTVLLSAKFAQGDGGGVLAGNRLLGRFFWGRLIGQRFARCLFDNRMGKLADVGRLGFFA